eukprot:3681988-Pyramimonas_sp.AAC.2
MGSPEEPQGPQMTPRAPEEPGPKDSSGLLRTPKELKKPSGTRMGFRITFGDPSGPKGIQRKLARNIPEDTPRTLRSPKGS